MSVELDTSEVLHLAADLTGAALGALGKVQAAIAKTAYDIAADAQQLAPVDTGTLRASISPDVTVLGFAVGPTVDYGIFQELGTSTQAGTAFMGPAFDRRLPLLEQTLGQIGSDVL